MYEYSHLATNWYNTIRLVIYIYRGRLVSQATPFACRERIEGSGHAATIELSPQQKLDVTNQIHVFRRSHPVHSHGVQLRHNMFSGCQHILLPNCNGQ